MIRYRAERLVVVDYTPASALAAGVPVRLPDGRVGVTRSAMAAGEQGAVAVVGLFDVDAASATVFAVGDEVWYDASAGQAVLATDANLDADLDYRLGVCAVAKANGDSQVGVDLNGAAQPVDSIVLEYEFDVATGGTGTSPVTLLDPEANQTGLLIEEIYAEITEAMAGSTEDQGVVVIKDTDASPATLATLTPSDAAADAVGDLVAGYFLAAGSTGDALKKVAAGDGITGTISQETAGTPAGKMRVRIKARPLDA